MPLFIKVTDSLVTKKHLPAKTHWAQPVHFCSDPLRLEYHEEYFQQFAHWCSRRKKKHRSMSTGLFSTISATLWNLDKRLKKETNRTQGNITSKTRCTSSIVINPFLSLSNMWNRFLYLQDKDYQWEKLHSEEWQVLVPSSIGNITSLTFQYLKALDLFQSCLLIDLILLCSPFHNREIF